LSHLALTSITAVRFWNWQPLNDADFSPVPVSTGGVRDYERQYTQEFRVASVGENKIDYVAGIYLYREPMRAVAHSQFGAAASYYMLGTAIPSIVADGVTNDSVSHYTTGSTAIYGQAVWHVAPRLNLTGGLRYTWDTSRGSFAQVITGGVPLTGANAQYAASRASLGTNTAFNLRNNNSKLSWAANVSYQVTPSILTYANYARGSKSGGLNLQVLPAGAKLVVAPEQVDAVELGVKTDFLERRVTLNAAAFWERDNNYQGNVFDQNLNRLYISNIPEVRVQGIETDIQARPFEDLSLYAAVTYNEGEYVKDPAAQCGIEAITKPSCNLSGQTLSGVPRWAFSTGGEYSHPLHLGAREAQIYVGADLNYRSWIYSQPTNSITSRLPALALLNARAGVRTDRWDLYFWAKNITNKNYLTFVSPTTGNTGGLKSQVGDPQTWGLTVRYKY
jgi:iron complex outermembrane receptor protein